MITPALCTSQPLEVNPSVTRSAIQALDSRVSCPITTLGRAHRCESDHGPARGRSGRCFPGSREIRRLRREFHRFRRVVGSGMSFWFRGLMRRRLLAGSFLHDNRHPHRIGIRNLDQRIGNISMPEKVARSDAPLTSTGSVIADSTASTASCGPLMVMVAGSTINSLDAIAGNETCPRRAAGPALAG